MPFACRIGKLPILGICLGSQLIAHALGAKVYPNPRGKEIGYYELSVTSDGKKHPILGGFPNVIQALEWHGDAFDLPLSAELLATSPICENQAFAHGKAYGFLFHFEFTPSMVRHEIEVDREWTHKNFDLDEEKLISEADELAAKMKEQCFRLLDNFLS